LLQITTEKTLLSVFACTWSMSSYEEASGGD